MDIPISKDSLMNGSQDFGLIPPEVKTPRRITLAPNSLASFKQSTIGISFLIIDTSEIFFPL